MKRSSLSWAFVIVGILALSLATLGAKQGQHDLYGHYRQLANVVDEIKDKYVEDVDVDKLFEGAIKGMLATLPDPYNGYFTGAMLEQFHVDTEGKFGGLGIEITISDRVLTVLTPIVGTPAFRAGVEAGDKIIKIDGESTENLSLTDAVTKLRGPAGAEVTITVLREGEPQPIDIPITRAVIVVPSLRGVRMIDERAKIGYIWLTNFQRATATELEQAVDELMTKGMGSLVLDLRHNPGGLLPMAIAVSDLFLEEGVIVKTKGRKEDEEQEFHAKPNKNHKLAVIPIVLLVNSTSASASEIVAGALRDHKRAIVVGTRTFGKGSVQTVITMEQGKAALKLTTARYYTPSDKPILRDKGIEPDIVVELTREQQKRLNDFLRQEHIRENQNGELKEVAPKAPDGKEQPKLTWETVDLQLVRAVDMLRFGKIFYERLVAGGK